jgi:uncharacterized protein (DUF1330 family)
MSAYVIFCMPEVTDMDALLRYRAVARPTLIAHGARVLCGPDVDETLEGPQLKGAIVLEFESMDAAHTWYNSPEYQAAADIRKTGTTMMAFMVKGR